MAGADGAPGLTDPRWLGGMTGVSPLTRESTGAPRRLNPTGIDPIVKGVKRVAPYLVAVALAGGAVGVAATGSPVRAASTTSSHQPHPSPVPAVDGQPDNGARVDSRLVSDVTTLIARYHVMVVAGCGGGRPWGPHAPYGEHPICDAADLVPQHDSNPHWPTMMRLARALGWRPACEQYGCEGAGTLNPSLRAIYYNGYPGHGDPAHNPTSAHLHISWHHAPVSSKTYKRSLDRHPWPAAAWVTPIFSSDRSSAPTARRRKRPRPSSSQVSWQQIFSGGASPTAGSPPPAGGASVIGEV